MQGDAGGGRGRQGEAGTAQVPPPRLYGSHSPCLQRCPGPGWVWGKNIPSPQEARVTPERVCAPAQEPLMGLHSR